MAPLDPLVRPGCPSLRGGPRDPAQAPFMAAERKLENNKREKSTRMREMKTKCLADVGNVLIGVESTMSRAVYGVLERVRERQTPGKSTRVVTTGGVNVTMIETVSRACERQPGCLQGPGYCRGAPGIGYLQYEMCIGCVDSGDLIARLSEGRFLSPLSCLSFTACLLYTSPSPRDRQKSRMPSSA